MSSSLTLNGKTIDGGTYEYREGILDEDLTVRWLPVTVATTDGPIFRQLVDEFWPGHLTIVQVTPPPGSYRLTSVSWPASTAARGKSYRLDV